VFVSASVGLLWSFFHAHLVHFRRTKVATLDESSVLYAMTLTARC